MSKDATIVKVSPKYQIVIPRAVREQSGVSPGTRFEVLVTETGLQLVRVGPLAELKGRVRRDEGVEIREKGDRL
jgi:AbrB family looped-hinge helix DNA binding protein